MRALRHWVVVMMFVAGCGGSVIDSDRVEASSSRDATTHDVFPDGREPDVPDAASADARAEISARDALVSDAPPTKPACQECSESHCGSLGRACSDDDNCERQSYCRAACIDEECADKCRATYPSPVYDEWLSCLTAHCAAPCGI